MKGIPLHDKDGNPLFEIPRILEVYLFCSPRMDLSFRCMPKIGGYWEQDYIDIVRFTIIESKIREVMKREEDAYRKRT